MAEFLSALDVVLKNEGGLVEDKNDPGGITNWGISYRFYSHKVNLDGTVADIKNLSLYDATAIYRKYFWDKHAFASLYSQKLANKVFDLNINTGQGVTFLQQSINRLDLKAHLVVDSALGEKTAIAANALPFEPLYITLLSTACEYYYRIAKDTNRKYLVGWLNRLYD